MGPVSAWTRTQYPASSRKATIAVLTAGLIDRRGGAAGTAPRRLGQRLCRAVWADADARDIWRSRVTLSVSIAGGLASALHRFTPKFCTGSWPAPKLAAHVPVQGRLPGTRSPALSMITRSPGRMRLGNGTRTPLPALTGIVHDSAECGGAGARPPGAGGRLGARGGHELRKTAPTWLVPAAIEPANQTAASRSGRR